MLSQVGLTNQVSLIIEGYLDEMRQTIAKVSIEDIHKMVAKIEEARLHRKHVFLFGNGGSAATASHLAVDFAKGTIAPGKPRLRATALNDNIPLISAWANDLSYDEVFSQELQSLVEPGDVVIGISTSGRSPNVINGLKVARSLGATTIGLTGRDGGQMKSVVDLCIMVPDNRTGQIEDIHLMLGHIVTACLSHKPLE